MLVNNGFMKVHSLLAASNKATTAAQSLLEGKLMTTHNSWLPPGSLLFTTDTDKRRDMHSDYWNPSADSPTDAHPTIGCLLMTVHAKSTENTVEIQSTDSSAELCTHKKLEVSEYGKPENTELEPAENTAAVHRQQPAVDRHAADAASHDVTASAQNH